MERHHLIRFTLGQRPLLPLLPKQPQQTRRAHRPARQTRRHRRPDLRPSTRHTASSSRGSGRERRPTLLLVLAALRPMRLRLSCSSPTRRACSSIQGARHRVRRETRLQALLGRRMPGVVLRLSTSSLCSRASGSGRGRASPMPASAETHRAAYGSTRATVPSGPMPSMLARARMDPSRLQSLRAGQRQSPIASSSRCPVQLVHRPRQRLAAPKRRHRLAIPAPHSGHLALHRHPPAQPLLQHPRHRAPPQTRPMLASCPSYLCRACPSLPSVTHSTRTVSWPPSSAQASSTGQLQRRSCGAPRHS